MVNNIEQTAEILSSFGLTVKQAKVYLTLVFLGIAPVGEISKISKVRREEVYRILPKLETLGLVEKTLTTPVKLNAISVENALSILIKEEEERSKNRLIDLKLKKDDFLKKFRAISKEDGADKENQFSLIIKKAVSLSKIEGLLNISKAEIKYCGSKQKLLQFLKLYSPALKEAADRGINIQIISTPDQNEDDLTRFMNRAKLSNNVLLRYMENLPSHFLLIDKKEVLIATTTSGLLAENPILWSNNPPQVSVYRNLFDELWNSSVESAALTHLPKDEKIVSFMRQLSPPSHFMFIYETKEAKLSVLLIYTKFALENNESVVYICSEMSVEEIREEMLQSGLEVEKHEKTGALKILDYTQHYIIDGKFNLDTPKNLLAKYYDKTISRGFRGMRIITETDCFFKHNLLKEFVEYEKLLHQGSNLPLISIYAYLASQLMDIKSGNIYNELLKNHPKVLFSLVDENFGRIAIS